MFEFLKRKLWKSALITQVYRLHGVNIEALQGTIGKGELDEIIKAQYYLSAGDPVEGARNVSQLIFERWGISLSSLASRARLEAQLNELNDLESGDDEAEDDEDEDDDGDDQTVATAEPSPPSALDAVIRAVYGDHPPVKSANVEQAIAIAHADLLYGQIPLSEVEQVASALFAGPIPYSTTDLAVSIALAFYRKPELKERLWESQMRARLRVLNWLKAGKVVGPLAQSFEKVLYQVYQITETEVEPEDEISDVEVVAKTDSTSPTFHQPAVAYFEEAVALTDENFAKIWKFDPDWVGLLSVATDLDEARGNTEKMDEITGVVTDAFMEGQPVAQCAALLLIKHMANQRELEKMTHSPLWTPPLEED